MEIFGGIVLTIPSAKLGEALSGKGSISVVNEGQSQG